MLRLPLLHRRLASADSARILALLLLGAVCVPLIARPLGWRGAMPRGPLSANAAAVAAVGVAIWIVAQLRLHGCRALGRIAVVVGSLAGLALLLAAIMQRRANAFFTATVLVEVMALLLVQHLAGMGLRRLTVPEGTGHATARRATVRRMATDLADDFTVVLGLLVLFFWILATLAMHRVAGVVLLLAAGTAPLALLARLFAALADVHFLAATARRAGGRVLRSTDAQRAPPRPV